MYRLSKNGKMILCLISLFACFVLTLNTNNIPETYGERIFKPIKEGTATIYYNGIIILVIIYISLRALNKLQENFLIKTGFRCAICTLVLLNVFTIASTEAIKIYKGFYTDLNSIYMDRERTEVNFNRNSEGLKASGYINIINCSSNVQKFHVKIKSPYFVKKDLNEDYIELEKEYTAYPKKETFIDIYEYLKNDYQDGYGYGDKAIEYILYNDDSLVIFRGTENEYESEIRHEQNLD